MTADAAPSTAQALAWLRSAAFDAGPSSFPKAVLEHVAWLVGVADAARAVAEKWEDMRACYSSTAESVALAELLDQLLDAVKGARHD